MGVATAQQIKHKEINLPKNNTLKISLLSAFAATLNMSYEYKLTQAWSVQHGLSFTKFNPQVSALKSTSIEGFRYTLDLRKYRKIDPEWNGWYNQYFVRYGQFVNQNYKQDSSTQNQVIQLKESLRGFNFGYAFGYQKCFDKNFVLDTYLGIYFSAPTYYKSSLSQATIDKYEIFSLKESPLTSTMGLRFGIKAGYLF